MKLLMPRFGQMELKFASWQATGRIGRKAVEKISPPASKRSTLREEQSMDARLFRAWPRWSPRSSFWAYVPSQGASFSTQNFVVTTVDPDLLGRSPKRRERYRPYWPGSGSDMSCLAGSGLARFRSPWDKSAQGGAHHLHFAAGQVFGWNMKVQGTPERVLDSVIPHEVSHTIFASYFRRPLPRWADEGAASLVEHESEHAPAIAAASTGLQHAATHPADDR